MHSLLETIFTEDIYVQRKQPVIIIAQPWNEIAHEEKEQLLKITEALKQRIHPSLSFEAFQIVSQDSLNLNELADTAGDVIYFGPEIKGLPLYEVVTIDTTSIVLSHPLKELLLDEGLRGKLWAALKQLFAAKTS